MPSSVIDLTSWFFHARYHNPSGVVPEGAQHPEQTDASDVQPADEAGDRPNHRHRGEVEGSHRLSLREGHR